MTNAYDFSTIAMDVHMYEDHIRFFDTNRRHIECVVGIQKIQQQN